MHPGAYVRMDSFPLNANGKVNRLVLKEPERKTQFSHEEPKTNREVNLLAVARQVMKMDNLGVTDNLIEMGMDSISAVEMVSLASDRGITIKANDIMIHKTVRNLSESRMSLLYWYLPPTETKPVLVLSCGIIGTELLEKRVRSLSEHYDILVIEPFYDHYEYLAREGDTFEDIVGLYHDLIDTVVSDKIRIAAFIGFSYGGTIAYKLGRMHFTQTGLVCRIICGDSPLKFASYRKMTPEQEAERLEILRSAGCCSVEGEEKIIFYGEQAVGRLMSDWKAEPTPLEVMLFHCKGNYSGDLMPTYHDLVTKLTVVEVPESHLGFCLDGESRWRDFTVSHTLQFLQAKSK